MSTDQVGIIDLERDEWVSPDIPLRHRTLMVTPADLVGERPGGEVTTRPATQEEYQRYGISHPLRAELVGDIQAGLELEAIAAKYGVPVRDIANKVVNWWYRVMRSFPEGQDEAARQVWSQAAAVLGIRDRRPPPPPREVPQPETLTVVRGNPVESKPQGVRQQEAPTMTPFLPPGLTIRSGQQLRATVNDQGYTVSDVLTHLKTVEEAAS